MKHRALLPILVFGLCGSLQVSLAESSTFTKIEMPGGADLTISASRINNVGQSVGSVIDTHAFPQGGFLDINNVFTHVNVPGAFPGYVAANGINNGHQIVGTFGGSFFPILDQGFLDKDNVFTTIDVPGGSSTNVYGINNVGQIVGSFLDNTLLNMVSCARTASSAQSTSRA
jgi:uncharacterized membrane protein